MQTNHIKTNQKKQQHMVNFYSLPGTEFNYNVSIIINYNQLNQQHSIQCITHFVLYHYIQYFIITNTIF